MGQTLKPADAPEQAAEGRDEEGEEEGGEKAAWSEERRLAEELVTALVNQWRAPM
jgi:hypothetical protein